VFGSPWPRPREQNRRRYARLLRVIAQRRHGCLEDLYERAGLSIPELQQSLLRLELDGRIRRNGSLFSAT
jgi:predicted Rossmann fold nucleotide-binding protein DprA/Smf involved in DNA uptake